MAFLFIIKHITVPHFVCASSISYHRWKENQQIAHHILCVAAYLCLGILRESNFSVGF